MYEVDGWDGIDALSEYHFKKQVSYFLAQSADWSAIGTEED